MEIIVDVILKTQQDCVTRPSIVLPEPGYRAALSFDGQEGSKVAGYAMRDGRHC